MSSSFSSDQVRARGDRKTGPGGPFATVLTPDETTGARSAVPGDRQVALRSARLTRDFWRGETARCAWLWTLLLAAGVILNCFANVTVNRWNGWFFDALERKDGHSALVAMAVFPVIVLVVAGLGVLILKSRDLPGSLAALADSQAGRWLGRRPALLPAGAFRQGAGQPRIPDRGRCPLGDRADRRFRDGPALLRHHHRDVHRDSGKSAAA